MDLQAYIQSGILEAYALGALPASEVAEVEAQLGKFPELQAELDALQEALRQYAEAEAEAPVHDLETRIWSAIEAARMAQGAPASANHEGKTPTRVVSLPSATYITRTSFSFARAAVWAGLLGSLILNAILWNDRQAGRDRIAQLEARTVRQSTFFASQLSDRDKQLQGYALMKDLMADPAVKTVRLENMNMDEERAGIVFQNTSNGTAYLAVQKLPAPPPGKQYQLWVLDGGAPKGIALLQGQASNPASLADIQLIPVAVARGEAFAISIEEIGGSLTPTMDQIVMLGKVRA